MAMTLNLPGINQDGFKVVMVGGMKSQKLMGTIVCKVEQKDTASIPTTILG